MLPQQVSVAVFAYNEEASIAASLDAIGACATEASLTVHVLINGTTDSTEDIVRAYRPDGFVIKPVVIKLGDKANAWNTYVHEIAPEAAAIHVFTDGDMEIAQGSISGFLERFAAEPDANGCAALPTTGRSREQFASKLRNQREMAGNLYALRGRCVMEFRRRGIRLPVGMFGEDGLVATLVKYDLDTLGQIRDERIAVSEVGGFAYPSLSPFRAGDWRTYRNRRMRYAVRRQQANMLYPILFKYGVSAMPAHVADMYKNNHHLMELRWNGLDTYFDWIAYKRICRDLKSIDTAKKEDRAHLYS